MGNLLEGCTVPSTDEDEQARIGKINLPRRSSSTSPVKAQFQQGRATSNEANINTPLPPLDPFPADQPHKVVEQSDRQWYIPFDSLTRTEAIGASSGIGIVFKTTYGDLDTVVAAKRLPMPLMGKNTLDVAYIDMMKAEGDKLTNLRHANILSFHHMSIYRSDRSGRYDLYLIMDMMSCSFNQLVFSKDPKFKQQRAKLGGKDRQRILIQIASGLAYLHYHGIVHRNLKPTNILCNDTLSVVKVADFGKAATLREHELDKLDALAASQSAENSENKQRKGSRLYVAAFMAPEQVVSDGKITLYPSQKGRNKVDSYSYAMILYAFTTGLRPYADFKSGGKMFTMMEQILDGLRPTMPSAYPTVLKELLEKCWCKNPNDRLSMTKVQRELQSAPVLKALGDVWVP